MAFSNGLFDELLVEGHQEHSIASKPASLICTATSTLIQNFQDSLIELVDGENFEFYNRSGYSLVRRKAAYQPDEKFGLILDTIVKANLIGLKRLEFKFSSHIRVSLKEI
jgi:uncharacterized protein YsxB (DUF464 family)